jgi:hypothetical protein
VIVNIEPSGSGEVVEKAFEVCHVLRDSFDDNEGIIRIL